MFVYIHQVQMAPILLYGCAYKDKANLFLHLTTKLNHKNQLFTGESLILLLSTVAIVLCSLIELKWPSST